MATVNNTNVPYGSRLLTISGSVEVSAIAEDIELRQRSTIIERMNQIGEMSGQVIIDQDFGEGSATLQVPSTIVGSYVGVGDYFTTTFSSSHKYYISSVSFPETNTTDKKVRIEFRQEYLKKNKVNMILWGTRCPDPRRIFQPYVII